MSCAAVECTSASQLTADLVAAQHVVFHSSGCAYLSRIAQCTVMAQRKSLKDSAHVFP